MEAKPRRWILDQTWLNLVQLSSLPPFTQILIQVRRPDPLTSEQVEHKVLMLTRVCPGEPE